MVIILVSACLSGDGQSLVVGAPGENNKAGAAYLFSLSESSWTEQNLVRARNKESNDRYGFEVSMSDDGSTFAVGATGEDSNATGTSNDGTGEENNSAGDAGAVYMY